MKTMRTILFCLLLSTFSFSQVKITPMADGSTANCAHVIQRVQQLLPQFIHPARWNVVVACDEDAWHSIQRMAPGTIGRTDYAFSDPTTLYTYINGPTLLIDEDTGRTRPAFILAHEAAHIITGCKADKAGEKKADEVAEQLINKTYAMQRGGRQ